MGDNNRKRSTQKKP